MNVNPESHEDAIVPSTKRVAILPPTSGRRILVMDESEVARKLTKRSLERRLGCSVVATGDGPTGLELGLRATFDVVVLNENLPGLSGLEICRILSVLPSGQRPLIIFRSDGSRSRSEVRSAGADLFMSHDTDGDNLVVWVRVYLISHPSRKKWLSRESQDARDDARVPDRSLREDSAWLENGFV